MRREPKWSWSAALCAAIGLVVVLVAVDAGFSWSFASTPSVGLRHRRAGPEVAAVVARPAAAPLTTAARTPPPPRPGALPPPSTSRRGNSLAPAAAAAWYERDGGAFSFDELVEQWRSEPADQDWSGNIASFIYAMLEPAELEHEVIRSVDCRNTLCRVQFDTRQMNTLLRLNESLAAEAHSPFSEHFDEGEDGGSVVEVMIARDDLASRVFAP